MSSLSLRAAGLAATAVLAGVALAPAASASAPMTSTTVSPGCVVTSTSPLKVTCTPVITAPPGVITVGKVLKITLGHLKPGTTITFVLHGGKTVKLKVGKNGSVTFSYRTKAAGKLVFSVSGKTATGKGFGKSYHTTVKSRSKGSAVGGTVSNPRAVLTGAVPGSATSIALNAGRAVQVTTSHGFTLAGAAKASDVTPIAKGGVSLNGGEDGALALVTFGLLGGAAGLTRVGRKQASRDRRRAAARSWKS